MKGRFKIGISLLFICFWFGQVNGQATPEEWTPYFENETVAIDLRHAHRSDSVNGIYNNYILIRVANKSQHTVSVDFQKQLSYNQQPSTSDPIQPLLLQPGEMITGSTDPGTSKALRIFLNQEKGFNKNVLTDYALINIHTETIQD